MNKPILVRDWKHWSPHHIQTAAVAARSCLDLEAAGSRGPLDLVKQRGFVTTSVFHSVAFLEALANELMASCDLEPYLARVISRLSGEQISRLAALWRAGADRLAVMSKFQIILGVLDRQQLDPGRQPYQDAYLVVRLRNDLVHYKPELIERDLGTPGELKHWLGGKFEGNPFVPTDVAGLLDWYLGAGCAVWAVRSCLAFADDFYSRLGVTPLYAEAPPLARGLLEGLRPDEG